MSVPPKEELQKVIIAGVILGVVAAGVVWFLERFETNRLTTELRTHLDSMSDEYKAWLAQRPGGQV